MTQQIIKIAKAETKKQDIFKFMYQVGILKYRLKVWLKFEENWIFSEPLDTTVDIFCCAFD